MHRKKRRNPGVGSASLTVKTKHGFVEYVRFAGSTLEAWAYGDPTPWSKGTAEFIATHLRKKGIGATTVPAKKVCRNNGSVQPVPPVDPAGPRRSQVPPGGWRGGGKPPAGGGGEFSQMAMEARVVKAMQRTWQAIGQDLLDASGGKPYSAPALREIIFDGEHIEHYGRDPEAVKWFRAQPRPAQKKMLEKAFPSGQRYANNPARHVRPGSVARRPGTMTRPAGGGTWIVLSGHRTQDAANAARRKAWRHDMENLTVRRAPDGRWNLYGRIRSNPGPAYHKREAVRYAKLLAGDLKAGHKDAADYWQGALSAEAAAVAAGKVVHNPIAGKLRRCTKMNPTNRALVAKAVLRFYQAQPPSIKRIMGKMSAEQLVVFVRKHSK